MALGVGAAVQRAPVGAAVVADDHVRLAVVAADGDGVLVGVHGGGQSPDCLAGSMDQHLKPKFQYGPGTVQEAPPSLVSKTSSRPA